MNWDQIEGNWKQFKGKVKEQWGKLTDDHIDMIAGKRDQLSGKIQESYGISKEEADKQISDWERKQKQEYRQSHTDKTGPHFVMRHAASMRQLNQQGMINMYKLSVLPVLVSLLLFSSALWRSRACRMGPIKLKRTHRG